MTSWGGAACVYKHVLGAHAYNMHGIYIIMVTRDVGVEIATTDGKQLYTLGVVKTGIYKYKYRSSIAAGMAKNIVGVARESRCCKQLLWVWSE